MNLKEKIDRFSHMALKEAEEERDTMLRQFENEFAAACAEYLSKAKEKMEASLRERKFRIDRKNNKVLLAAKSNKKYAIHELKQQLLDELLTKTRELICYYVEKDEYSKNLINDITSIAEKYPGKIEVFLCNRDIILLENISLPDRLVLIADDGLIGGFRANIADKSIVIDLSYNERLDKAMGDFRGFKSN